MCTLAQILNETVEVLAIYGKRTLVLRDVFKGSGEEHALKISTQLNEILLENSKAEKRLQAARESGQSDVLADVWNISRMKQVYHPILKEYTTSTALCATWKNRPEILELFDLKNYEILKDDFHRYVNTSSFPTVVKDHLFNLLNLIVKYNSKMPTPLRHRFEDLIQWLDKEQPTISGIKGFPVSSMPSALKNVNDLVLKMDTFRLPTCDSKDAEKCDVILSAQHVIVRTVRGKMFRKNETVEHQEVAVIELQEAYDDASFELLGVGFTKVLTADCSQTRDDWMRSIREVKRTQIKTVDY